MSTTAIPEFPLPVHSPLKTDFHNIFKMLRPHSIDVSRCMVFHGQTWLADRPELDINSITFRCWTAQGQLVEAFPNGRVYYIHDGLLRIFPINLLYSTSLPVYWIGTIPVLACEQDLQPLFDCPDMPVDIYSSFPNVPILHVTGPALDIQLIQLTPEGTLPVQIPRQIPRGPEMKAVNAFIAYRAMYCPFIPLFRQMEISGIIRQMWQHETYYSKIKFNIAARTYTSERNERSMHGLPKIPLKEFMHNNARRFQMNPPRYHVVHQALNSLELSSLIALREYLLAEDNDGWIFAPSPTGDLALEFLGAIDERQQEIERVGLEVILAKHYSSLHFAPFDEQLAQELLATGQTYYSSLCF